MLHSYPSSMSNFSTQLLLSRNCFLPNRGRHVTFGVANTIWLRCQHSSPQKNTNQDKSPNDQPGKQKKNYYSSSPRYILLSGLTKMNLNSIQLFYDEFSGMSLLKNEQKKVAEIHDKLDRLQQRKLAVQQELILVRKELHDVQAKIQETQREKDHYLVLLREEFVIKAKEEEKKNILEAVDQEERELLTKGYHAEKCYHREERAHASRIRSWWFVGTITVGLIALLEKLLSKPTPTKKIEKMHSYLEMLVESEKRRQKERSAEGWISWTKRQALRPYRYFVPASKG